ncbi:universal stress protein UspA [Lentilactobacillus fungorum]|jgi:nucleotide-binding universal stress UspA family protein|uniref:Universal stress protein UspA n=1 Tax=Lentilactobacillus fungorum TaxID=2201250 RepID=A0ABQ3VXI7_9LACO|nr:universal stress protein [Lentilactobacillus fungorum]GHP13049.1 universal stress protein UspA [Lentilactobacillus fungorum]
MLEFNYQTILVGVDGSKTADKAVSKAIAIANRNAARLVIATVINNRDIIGVSKTARLGFGNVSPETIDRLKNHYQRLVDKYAKQAEDSGVKVKTIVTTGDPKTVLAREIVLAENIDAIVIGATGANFVGRVTMGSTAAFVIAQAPCDVFVVHRDRQ